MSAISWNAEAPATPLVSSNALKILALRLSFGLGLILATSAAYTGILLTILMGSSIIEF
jgi:hypothetical protein